MNNLDWLCENDREQLRRILRDDVELCEWCVFDEATCDWECGSGTRLWLDAEHVSGPNETANGADAGLEPRSDQLEPDTSRTPKVDACGRISAEDFAQAVSDGMEKLNAAVESHGETHDFYAFDELDTREKLQADIDDCHWLILEDEKRDVLGWLDRQAAITERELCKGCDWPYLAAQPDQEAYDRIAGLEAELEKRDKGIARLKAQRDMWRGRLSMAVGYAQAIERMTEVDA